MSASLPPRSAFTDALVLHLTEHELLDAQNMLVGDGRRPTEAGWPTTPGQGAFVASMVVETLEGTPEHRQDVAGQHGNWQLRYRLSTVGGLRKQADDSADAVRAAAITLPHGSTPDALKIEQWKLGAVVFTTLAPVVKQGGMTDEWPTWQVDDVVTLSVSRSRS